MCPAKEENLTWLLKLLVISNNLTVLETYHFCKEIIHQHEYTLLAQTQIFTRSNLTFWETHLFNSLPRATFVSCIFKLSGLAKAKAFRKKTDISNNGDFFFALLFWPNNIYAFLQLFYLGIYIVHTHTHNLNIQSIWLNPSTPHHPVCYQM